MIFIPKVDETRQWPHERYITLEKFLDFRKIKQAKE
jgi:hypothetical protein